MIERVAYNLGRNDEGPNIELAELLSVTKDKAGISEIVAGLKNKKKEIANDCIKVLYEIGDRTPELISEYVLNFIELLKSKNNRLVWGGMTALSKIAHLRPGYIFDNLDIVLNAYESGSVITVDNSISVFAELCRVDQMYENTIFKILLKHLSSCKPKEVAQHAERAFVCVNKSNSAQFREVLLNRSDSLTYSQRKRICKLIQKIEKGYTND